jgi:hypothetical protein
MRIRSVLLAMTAYSMKLWQAEQFYGLGNTHALLKILRSNLKIYILCNPVEQAGVMQRAVS